MKKVGRHGQIRSLQEDDQTGCRDYEYMQHERIKMEKEKKNGKKNNRVSYKSMESIFCIP